MKLQNHILRIIALLALILPISVQASPHLRLSHSQLLPETKIEIYFDQAVVKQDQVGKILPNTILEISPQWQGKLIWNTTNSAEFLPDSPPKMGTEYSFKLLPDIKQLDGTPVLAKDLRKAQTEKFSVYNVHTTGALRSNRRPTTYVCFNDNVNPADLQNFIYYKNRQNQIIPATIRHARRKDIKRGYRIKPNWYERFKNMLILRTGAKLPEQQFLPEDIVNNAIIITPVINLPIGKYWSLYIKKNAPNATATFLLDEEDSYLIGSVYPFHVSSIKPVNGLNSPRYVSINFNIPLPPKLTPEFLASFIEISPRPENLQFHQINNYNIKATGDFNQPNNYRIRIKPGLIALNGLEFNDNIDAHITFTYHKSSINLPSYTLAQLSKGERLYGIDTVNMKSLQVQIKQLSTEQAIRTFLGYNAAYLADNNDSPLPIALISGKTLLKKNYKLNNPIDTSKHIELSWNDILPQDTENAMLFVSATAEPNDLLHRKQANRVRCQSIVQLTDIGLAWKYTKDKLWIYAYSCDTGKPLPNVKLSIRDNDAQPICNTQTDQSGLGMLPRDKNQDAILVATLGSDTFIVSLTRYLDTVRMWRFPVNFRWKPAPEWNRDLLVFTDRSLYKPGETVRIKGILREVLDNHLRISADKTIQYTLTDPYEKKIGEGTLTLTPQGGFDFSIDLPEDNVGRYEVHFNIPEKEEDSQTNDKRESDFYLSFYVEEFRRNAYEITSTITPPEPNATTVNLHLEANYYQGTPVAEGKLDWYFRATSTGFYPDKFRDFYFADHRQDDPYYWSYYFGYYDGSAPKRNTVRVHGVADLSADGSADVSIDIPKSEFPSPQTLHFTNEVTDSRNQTLTSHASTIVHPANKYFGISRIDRLIRVDDEINFGLVSIDLKGNFLKTDSTATVTIEREYYQTVIVQDKHGRKRNTNKKLMEKISEQPVTISAAQITQFPFSPPKPGRYIITIKGHDSQGNLTATASNFYVYGKNDYPWEYEDGIRIKLVAEKKSYKPGDTARILVMTPIEGTALVTVERLGVISHYRRELKADNPVIEIPVTADEAPNAYVSVLVIRGRADSKYKHKEPVLKLGFCSLHVETSKNKLNIALQIDGESHRPGEDITIHGKVTDAEGNPVSGAEVLLYAEDEGVLAVMGYTMPNPLAHFYRPRPLTIRTGVSLDYFISENKDARYYGNKGFVIGDGGPDDSMAQVTDIDELLRSNFDPCAIWAPTITTSTDGSFTITSKAPDTLTRYRIMALATAGAENFGSSKSSVIVNKDLMLEPAPPRFANEGDKLNTKILVQNASKFSGTWDITLQTDSLTMIDQGTGSSFTQTVSIAAGESTTLSFPVHFVNTGETTWKWSATPRSLDNSSLTPVLNHRLSDSIQTKFQVNYPRPLLRYANTINFSGNNKHLFNNVPKRLLNGRGKAELVLSNSLLVSAGPAFDFLLKYPYGCVEQTTSSMMPWFAANDLRAYVPQFQQVDEAKVLTAIQKGANRLLTMQTDSGGLAYWPRGESAENWATSYGGMALLMAKQHGANVPDSAIDGIIRYLSNMVRHTPLDENYLPANETLTRAIYVLALAGKSEASLINKYYEKRHLLDPNARAYLALAIHHLKGDKNMAIYLISADNPPKKTNYYWMPHRNTKALNLLAWSTIVPESQKTLRALQSLLASRNQLGHWHTTWVNGWALHAIARYAKNVESQLSDTSVHLNINNKEQTITLSKNNPTHAIQLSLEDAASLTATSNGKIFATVKVATKPSLAPAGAEAHNGLKIQRRYQRINADGSTSPLTAPHIGDLVKVNLDITFPDQIRYVVIDDPLPSVMETVNGDFASQSAHVNDPSKNNWNIDRRELRNDRALFFLNRSWISGTQTISYLARITSSGTVHAPAAKVEAMYDPSTFALTPATTIKIQK